MAKAWFPDLTRAASYPRATLIFEVGIQYMRDHRNEFDVILVDSTDPVGPAAGLFRKSFFEDCRDALRADGILCIQSESPHIPELLTVIKEANRDLRDIFQDVRPYTAAIQTYQAGLWLFQMAFKNKANSLVQFQIYSGNTLAFLSGKQPMWQFGYCYPINYLPIFGANLPLP